MTFSIVLGVARKLGGQPVPDYLSKPSMKLVRLTSSSAELKGRRPALPVD